MVLGLCGMVLGAIGPGGWSLDRALDIDDDLIGWTGLALSAGLGLIGAAVLLATSWRPPAPGPAPTEGEAPTES
jgi:putative oxidoreductase